MKYGPLARAPTRRLMLLGITVSFIPIGAQAFDDGGDFNAGDVKKWQRKTKKRSYSQEQFRRFTKTEIKKLYDFSIGGNIVIILGFSSFMSETLLFMAKYDRRATQRMVREMRKIKGKKARKARLKVEDDRARKQIADLKKSAKDLRKKGQKKAAQEDDDRRENVQRYREGLRIWIGSPSEGTKIK